MATVLVTYDDDNIPIVIGAEPPNPATPIANPKAAGFFTNKAALIAEGFYCLALKTTDAYAPLWCLVQAIDGQQVEAKFKKIVP